MKRTGGYERKEGGGVKPSQRAVALARKIVCWCEEDGELIDRETSACLLEMGGQSYMDRLEMVLFQEGPPPVVRLTLRAAGRVEVIRFQAW